MLTAALTMSGGSVVLCATCGAETLGLLRTFYRLSDMTGLQLYDQLHTQPMFQHLLIILMSATLPYFECEKRRLARLHKPFRMTELRETIQKALRGEEKQAPTTDCPETICRSFS